MKKIYYTSTKIKNVITVNEIVTIHYFEYMPDFYFKGERHDFWELVYLDSGSVEIQADSEKKILKPGDIVFHKPNEFHNIKSLNVPSNVFIITFGCNSKSEKALENLIIPADNTLKKLFGNIIDEAYATFDLPKNNPYMKKLVLKENPRLGGEQMIKTYLEQALLHILRELTANNRMTLPAERDTPEEQLAKNISEYILQNLTKRIYIEEICKQFGYSAAYISRIFKGATGKTLSYYIAEAKINEAKKLIRSGSKSFQEISDYLAFDNPQYFSKVFRKYSNMSPTEYKKSCLIWQ
ncbi:MAG: AraC family transcriptional regulator [Christensenellaceae bacterium]|nr:AraC family transcriptional regulator [Christensenellaceae bacterium]